MDTALSHPVLSTCTSDTAWAARQSTGVTSLSGWGSQMLHRLDVCTTGVLLLGRSTDANRRFSMDLQAHRVQKQYKAMR